MSIDEIRRERLNAATAARIASDEAKAQFNAAIAVLERLLLPGAVVIVKVIDPMPIIALAPGSSPPNVGICDWITISRSSAAIINEVERTGP